MTSVTPMSFGWPQHEGVTQMHHSEAEIRIVHVHAAPRPAAMARPRALWLFAGWMGASAAIAILGGLVLGILAALETGFASERWTQVVEAHGRLQLTGFVSVFVVALSFEFLARLYQRPMFPPLARAGVPGLLATGAIIEAAGQAWPDTIGFLLVPGAVIIAAGSVAFAVLAWRVRYHYPLSVEPQPLFFRAGSAWLAAAGILGVWTVARADSGFVVPVESHAVAELILRGFVINIIIAVGLRAFVGHLTLPPMTPRRQATVFALLNVSVVAWLAGQGLGALPDIDFLVRAGDLLFAAGLLVFTWWLQIFSPLRRGFHEPRYQWLIPLAWAGSTVYSVMLIVVALLPGGSDITIYQDGAIRHTFMLGFVLPLMAAMAHVVLARFGTGVIRWENILTVGCLMLIVAMPLRVLPVLFVDAPGDVGKQFLATAGGLTMVALILVATVAFQTARGIQLRLRGR